MTRTLAALALAAVAAPAFGAQAGKATFIDRDGKQVGTAVLSQTPNGVLIDLEIRGIAPGQHAFHIHEKGLCEADKGFESAAGHYDPRRQAHGFLADRGAHAGDMPNVFVPPDGTLRAHVLNADVTLGKGDATLFDGDGSALVLHAKPDDYRSQPSGAAGDRIACAVVKAVSE